VKGQLEISSEHGVTYKMTEASKQTPQEGLINVRIAEDSFKCTAVCVEQWTKFSATAVVD